MCVCVCGGVCVCVCVRERERGRDFTIIVNIFPMPKILNYFFGFSAFNCKIIRGNNLFYQLAVNIKKYLPKKGKVR